MKKNMFIAFIVCGVVLTGCTKAVNLTEDENNLVAEYAAGVLIDKSYHYENKYEKETTTAETTTAETTSEAETTRELPSINPGETTTAETTQSDVFNISGALNLKDLVVKYKDYKVCVEYPDDPNALFSFSADEGYKFIVIRFSMENPTKDPITVSTNEYGQIFKGTFNGTNYNEYGALLDNVLTNLKNVTVEAGKSEDVLVVFMVETKVADDLKSGTVNLKTSTGSYSMDIIKK